MLEQLPERLDKNFFVPMTPQQAKHHDENQEIVARIVAKWRRYGFLTEADQRRLMIALQNMRMACDSTYLLDQTTDHGVKADELATLLDELFEQPDTKVGDLQPVAADARAARCGGFESSGWEHVLFHGGVPSRKRKDLVDRFRDDAGCRAFLSTDAGGVGLNLQHATVVVNMDLPWNPAVLEQRIGRVHRLGQTQPVRVVNFVAQGTIEEGMLSVLKFKKSLFAGVLDGGEKEVFLGGTRLKRFMQGVEAVTGGLAEPPASTSAEPDAAEAIDADELSVSQRGDASKLYAEPHPEQGASDSGTSRSENPWAGLLQQGAALLQHLAAATSGVGGRGAAAASGNGQSFIGRDASTGESYLRIPMPAPEVLDQALRTLSTLLDSLRR